MGHFHLAFIYVLIFVFSSCVDSLYSVEVCKLPKLLNGVARRRSNGRIARFSCNPGYSLVGEKFAACSRGFWDVPTPICIKPGCNWNSEDFFAGSTLPSRGGAVLKFVCQPGLRLVGLDTIYCLGTQWSAQTPYCISPGKVSTSCNFEMAGGETLCGWRNLRTDGGASWHLGKGPTSSSLLGTGPKFDHTLAPSDQGHYLYIETSLMVKGQKAVLASPVYPPMRSNGTCFILWYHMFGKTIGTLNVYVNGIQVFTKSGDQGSRWSKGRIGNLPNSTSFQVYIEGVSGPGYTGDIAIDDLHFSDSYDCSSDKDFTSCEDRCGEDPNLHPRACHCHNDCHEFNACCDNYADVCTSRYKFSARTSEESAGSSGNGLAIAMATIVAVVLVALAVVTAWWFKRLRRLAPYPRGSGRNNADGAADVLFLAADEILDFSIPGADNQGDAHRYMESAR